MNTKKTLVMMLSQVLLLGGCYQDMSGQGPMVVDPYFMKSAVQSDEAPETCLTSKGPMQIPEGFDPLDSGTWPTTMSEQDVGILADCLTQDS